MRKISLVILAGLSCGAVHAADRWVGERIDQFTLATGLRQPTAGEQFQQVVHEVSQGMSSLLNDLTAPSSAPSSSNSAVSSSRSPRVPSARALQRQEVYAQSRPSSSSSTNKYSHENRPLPAGYASVVSVADPETRCDMLTRILNENKEAVIVVGGISTAALLGFAFYALKK